MMATINNDTRKALLASLAEYLDDLKTGKIVIRPFFANVRADEKDPTLLHFDFVPPIIRRDTLALPRELIQFHLEVEMHKESD